MTVSVDAARARPVLVVGMHRSGTSAVARVVNLLGVPTTSAADLMPGDEGNAFGYWESVLLSRRDEELLQSVSSSWATPPYPFDVQRLAGDPEQLAAGRQALEQVASGSSWVWKDPRICLLLPFWRAALTVSPAIVLVHRDPTEVAHSVQRRHGLSLPHALALWERYTRTSLRDAADLPCFVLNYRDLLESARERISGLMNFLSSHAGLETSQDALQAAVASLVPADRRYRTTSAADGALLSQEQGQLVRVMEHLAGAHERLPLVDIGDETSWTEPLLSSRRGLYIANRRLDDVRLTAQHEQNLREAEERRADALALELADVRTQLVQSRREAASFKAEVERHQAVGAEVAEVRERASQEIEAAMAAAEAARYAIDVIHASTSWKISAPVRALAPFRQAVIGRRRGGSLLRQTVSHVRREGVGETLRRARQEIRALPHEHSDYEEWVERYDDFSAGDRLAVERAVAKLERAPLISVIMPVYNTDPDLLSTAVESIRAQVYPYWELCIADDASTRGDTRVTLERLVASDNRILVTRRDENGGIAAATNDAVARATGDFVAFVDHDDKLAPDALYCVAERLDREPDLDLVYTDEDKIDERGHRYQPYFKPAFNPELLLAQNYFNHLTVVRRSLVERVGGLRLDLEGSQDHDLVLRLVEVTSPERIAHVPHVLYHWRQLAGATNFSRTHADRAALAGTRAVQSFLDRRGERAQVTVDSRTPGWQRVRWLPPEEQPEVTVVIPTRDRLSLLRACVEGLLHKTAYDNLRVLIADNDSIEPETLQYLEGLRAGERTDVVHVPGDFNYSAINNRAVERVDSPLVMLLNNDIEVDQPTWLQEMVGLLMRDGVGAVGAKLYYGNGSVQHAGVVLGIGGVAGHALKYRPANEIGYFGRLVLTQEVSAVTGACLLTRTSAWRELGGLDEDNLSVAFNDVDFCLRLREAGHRVIWAANAELRHLESVSRGREESARQVARFNRESAWMKRRWGSALHTDAAYNPNLTDVHEDYSLAYPPRVAKPWASS
jgi:GT2 family glycosyltransferase